MVVGGGGGTEYTITVGSNGTTSPSPSTFSLNSGESLSFITVPNEGYIAHRILLNNKFIGKCERVNLYYDKIECFIDTGTTSAKEITIIPESFNTIKIEFKKEGNQPREEVPQGG